MLRKRSNEHLTKKDIEHLSCVYYWNSNSFLATAFSNFPLPLKRHCVQVGAVAGLMALRASDNAIPAGMSRDEYANAVRYGGMYHDIGVYIVYNQRALYPTAGARFLREQIDEQAVSPKVRDIIVETVRCCCEQYDGLGYPYKLSGDDVPLHAGICSIANVVDTMMMTRRGTMANAEHAITEGNGQAFSPESTACFMTAYEDIAYAYKCWRKAPPFWKNGDIKPLFRRIEQTIG